MEETRQWVGVGVGVGVAVADVYLELRQSIRELFAVNVPDTDRVAELSAEFRAATHRDGDDDDVYRDDVHDCKHPQ